MFPRLKTPLLKNTGSTARDHLASERTFLAWLRTGLGFVALGIAVERFSQLDISQLQLQTPSPAPTPTISSNQTETDGNNRKPIITDRQDSENDDRTQQLVFGLLGTGSGAIVYGATRYFSNMRALERGMFKPAFYGAAGLSVAVAGLSVAVAGFAGVVGWGVVRDVGGRKVGR